eukprot:2066816-Amphidinium_carterae.2
MEKGQQYHKKGGLNQQSMTLIAYIIGDNDEYKATLLTLCESTTRQSKPSSDSSWRTDYRQQSNSQTMNRAYLNSGTTEVTKQMPEVSHIKHQQSPHHSHQSMGTTKFQFCKDYNIDKRSVSSQSSPWLLNRLLRHSDGKITRKTCKYHTHSQFYNLASR